MQRPPLLLAGLLAIGGASPALADRYEDARLQLEPPRGYVAEASSDPTGEWAVTVKRPGDASTRFVVLLGARTVADKDVETTAEKWHAVRLKNHVGWGMRAEGGPPREWLQLEGRRCVRFRDRIRGSLAASEEVMTCTLAGGRLACVVSVAPPGAVVDPVAAQLLRTLQPRKR